VLSRGPIHPHGQLTHSYVTSMLITPIQVMFPLTDACVTGHSSPPFPPSSPPQDAFSSRLALQDVFLPLLPASQGLFKTFPPCWVGYVCGIGFPFLVVVER